MNQLQNVENFTLFHSVIFKCLFQIDLSEIEVDSHNFSLTA